MALSSELTDAIGRVLADALGEGAFPGAIAAVGDAHGRLAITAVGGLTIAPSAPVDSTTIYDLASLTKIIGPTTAIARMVDDGRVELDWPVQRILPAWTGPMKERVTLRHLLTHTAGLPAFRAYDRETRDADSLAALMFATALERAPGDSMVYSDIGAWLLGRVVEAVSGEPLDVHVMRSVAEPLGLATLRYRPPAEWRPRIAPTEVDPARGGVVHGRTHDERAYWLGDVAGHAGLFGTVIDLETFAQAWLTGVSRDGRRYLSPETIAAFTRRQTANRALGWQKPTGDNSAGTLASEQAFGHTGFTGTSLWVDPGHGVYFLLLSNRVHPTRENTRIVAVRRRFADAVLGVVRHHTPPSVPSP